MKRKTIRIIGLSILGACLLGVSGYYLLRYNGSAPERKSCCDL